MISRGMVVRSSSRCAGAVACFAYLDYNGSLGRAHYKTGKKRREDISSMFRSNVFAEGAVLAVTLALRGITQTVPWEHVGAAHALVTREAKDAKMECVCVTAVAYKHTTVKNSSPMGFFVFHG